MCSCFSRALLSRKKLKYYWKSSLFNPLNPNIKIEILIYCFSFFETVFSLKLQNRQYLNLRLKSPSNSFLFFFPSVSVREPLILQHIDNFRHSVHRKSLLQLGFSITSPWQGELVSAVFRSEHPGIRVHRAARSHPQTASHSALRSWHSSFRVATVAKTQTNFSNVTMV